jgi:hypothetical protein
MARGRCITTTSATPGRARTSARCSGTVAAPARRRPRTSRSGTASTSSGHRHRSAPTADHLLRHGLRLRSVDTGPMTTNECLSLPPTSPTHRRRSAQTARSTWATATTRWSRTPAIRPKDLAQVEVQPRARGGHLATSGHRPLAAGRGTIYFTHDQSTDGAGIFTAPHGQRDLPDGQVEIQDRQLRQDILPGDRQERENLLRRSERIFYAFEDRERVPPATLLCNNLFPPNPSVGPVRIGRG